MLRTYQFSTIEVEEAPIDIATEIFTRINVGGQALTVFEIMVAKTYDEEQKFDLAERYDQLIERLSGVNYETVSSSTVLQSVAVCIEKDCTKKKILKLDKDTFIKVWDKVISSFESAVDYFRTFYRIPVSQLLPYDSLLVPFTYYFYNHKDKPLGDQQILLQDYFWRCVITQRFSSASESKLTQDISKIDDILLNKKPEYDEGVDIIPSNLELAPMDYKLVNSSKREEVLKNIIDTVKDKYDYILIDTSPSLNMITVNAFECANKVIIPIDSQFLADKGMNSILSSIMQIQKRVNKELKVGGIVLTMYDKRTNLSKEEQEDLKELIDYNLVTPSLAQAIKLKKLSQEGNLTAYKMESILEEEKANQKPKIRFNEKRLKEVLPNNIRDNEIKDYVIKSLDFYTKHRYKDLER